jgi:hypothetical protein
MNCLPVVNGQAESEGKQRGGEKYKESSRSPFAKHFSERLYELRGSRKGLSPRRVRNHEGTDPGR